MLSLWAHRCEPHGRRSRRYALLYTSRMTRQLFFTPVSHIYRLKNNTQTQQQIDPRRSTTTMCNYFVCIQVANEIEERQQFLLRAREFGMPCDSESEARIMGEISLRMGELKRLTPPSG